MRLYIFLLISVFAVKNCFGMEGAGAADQGSKVEFDLSFLNKPDEENELDLTEVDPLLKKELALGIAATGDDTQLSALSTAFQSISVKPDDDETLFAIASYAPIGFFDQGKEITLTSEKESILRTKRSAEQTETVDQSEVGPAAQERKFVSLPKKRHLTT